MVSAHGNDSIEFQNDTVSNCLLVEGGLKEKKFTNRDFLVHI